jgi:hypothetical protein
VPSIYIIRISHGGKHEDCNLVRCDPLYIPIYGFQLHGGTYSYCHFICPKYTEMADSFETLLTLPYSSVTPLVILIHESAAWSVTTLVPIFADGGCHNGSLRPYSRFSRPESLISLPSSSSIVLTRQSGPRSRPTTPQKIWQSRESNPDFWICSHEL